MPLVSRRSYEAVIEVGLWNSDEWARAVVCGEAWISPAQLWLLTNKRGRPWTPLMELYTFVVEKHLQAEELHLKFSADGASKTVLLR